MKQIFCADVNYFATDLFEGLQGYVVVVEHVKFPSCSVPLAQNNIPTKQTFGDIQLLFLYFVHVYWPGNCFVYQVTKDAVK